MKQRNPRVAKTMSDAEKKFWRTPELVDRLLLYLPVKDVSELAKVH